MLARHDPISITWSRYAPGERGPDPHVHREHSDAFYVLEGELTFGLGPAGDEVRVPAGGFVAAPPNLAHSFANESSAEARFLNLHAPDTGFVGSLRARRDGGDPSYDQFDPPADGGRPRADAIVSGPGEGERLVSGNRTALMKGVLHDMSLADWTIEGPFEGPELHRHESGVDAFYVIEGELEMTVEDSIHLAGPACAVAEWTIEGPFEGPHLHRHETGVDSFYVLEGELEMTVEGLGTCGRPRHARLRPAAECSIPSTIAAPARSASSTSTRPTRASPTS